MKIIRTDALNEFERIGLIHYTKIQVGHSPQMLRGRLRLFQEQLFFELEDRPLQETSFTQFQPSTFYDTIEKIQREEWQSLTNSGEDINLLYALQFSFPVHLNGNIQADYIIDSGALQRPLTEMVDESTTAAIQLFYFPNELTEEECQQRLEAARQFFFQIHGGTSTTYILKTNQTLEVIA